MKQISYSLLALILLLSGCSDYIDNEVTGKQNLDSFYSNYSECDGAIIGCYSTLSPQDWWEVDFFWLVGDASSDDAFKGNNNEGDQRDFGNLADFNITSSNEWVEYKWRFSYQGIYRCNLAIERIPEAPILQEEIDELVAEAKFLRAIFYFELVKNFGGVPLLTEPISIQEANLTRSSAEEIWAQIETDLKDASDFLPTKSQISPEKLGRATKGAAIAYLAKASLYQEKFTDAYDYAEQVENLGEHNLNDSFENVWSISNPNGNGSIFEIQHSYDDIYYSGSALPVLSRSRADGGWGFCTPSSHLDNFMGEDPRRVHTIIRHGEYVDEDHPSYDTDPSQNMTGRINRKYYLSFDERPPKDEHVRSGLNHILFRFADLLLMKAEAGYHTGKEGEALIAVNKVRQRAGVSEINVSGPALLQAIFDERRLELAMEGHRYYDLKRTGRLQAAMENFLNYNLNESTDLYDAGNDEGKYFNASIHTLFPIPQTEIDLSNGDIQQNPGY
ncbi:RagB/SusD family nutrient uptake outer membrane protein [Lutimonas saemankumensis]|uniref:RagB/SusD family nutrient uptake outer membrane protein n=1 Tax=Lutimonas saemankumensis TaxID=483016 RepID=UPI001CD1B3C8|nr:RagB/SusD family nutrient uptake outer membrane protein [Lutimonas saemankumensis]MCA0931711.1 RagB/SusD family nutrient uptake outer membrane protein [Lutimonas saemankumensis]